ncbi:MAG TPA: hypothetical protein VGQ51_14610 [Puia sp.]|nr:hypothetical protein [Puia sp.]
MNKRITVDKYLPVVLLYFFFNGLFLPLGLLYTSILAPVFLYWNLNARTMKQLLVFFAVALPFVVVHFINGVEVNYYLRSLVLVVAIYIFLIAFHRFVHECKTLRTQYKMILLVNIVGVAIAFIALAVPAWRHRFWYTNTVTGNIITTRLQMLTYEPSYYSTLFAPIALYYYLKMIVLKLPDVKTTAILVTVPLLLSLSFGVIIGMAVSLGLTLLYGSRAFFTNKYLAVQLLFGSLGFLLLIGLAMWLFPHNVFILRLKNVFAGHDNSFNGRTTDSFYLAWAIAKTKSVWFGCGLGQTKVIGLDLFRHFYNYAGFTVDSVAIPNVVGDTLATLGIIGLLIRFGLQVYFFFATRVWNNYYRLSLFLFIFIYQFTGSFLTNTAEYVIWLLAFSPGIFEEFDRKNFYINKVERP